MNRCIAILTALVLIVPCAAEVITVDRAGSAGYATIQEAINNSRDGDTIVVRPGTYQEQVGFNGRRVTVRSEDPDDPVVVAATVITGTTGHSVFFDFGESTNSVLEGFTINGQGIFCAGTAPTITKNVIRDCAGVGVAGESDAAPVIVGNTITGCAREAIYGCDGLIQGNTITHNNGGVAYSDGTIENNVISDNALEGLYACGGTIVGNTIERNSAGLAYAGGEIRNNRIGNNSDAGGLYYCDGQIIGNVIVGNVSADHGGGLFSCDGSIVNNVIAGNRAEGEGGGLYNCSQSICNNTIVGNIAATRGGGLSQCLGRVCNNIIVYNEASQAGGIFGPSDNTYNAFWANAGGHFGGNAVSGSGDVVVNPLFVANGAWNGNVWVHGDYHLRSEIGRWDPEAAQWVVDDVTSPGIDAGSPGSSWSAELWPHGRHVNLGAYGDTPQASWSSSEAGALADLDHDGEIGVQDLDLLTAAWLLDEDLRAEDLDRNGVVDLLDLAILALNWGLAPPDPTPPNPDPLTWQIEPYGASPYAIAMVATTAISTDGTGIEYYFENPYDQTVNSGWLMFVNGQEPRWEVSGLTPSKAYFFRVKARNRGNLLETDWSPIIRAQTQREDLAAPTPNPMTWDEEPYGAAADTIRMVATAAVDDSGVEYRFECTSHPAYSSAWQDSRVYEITSVPHGRYTFQVQARDKSGQQNTTLASARVTADLQPPTPDPMEWEIEPYEVRLGNDLQYGATMTAAEAVDESADVEYYFQCTTRSGFSSGWQSSPEYTVLVGRPGQRHRFRVKARDTSTGQNETGWSSEKMAQ